MKDHLVSVHALRDERVLVQPISRTVNGVMISDGLPHALQAGLDSRAWGEAIVGALEESNRRTLPFRDLRVDPPDRELLAWLGLKSYSQYARGVRAVSVYSKYDVEIGTVLISPERNGGPRAGFTEIREERVLLDFEGPEQLGRAVQEAMKKARA